MNHLQPGIRTPGSNEISIIRSLSQLWIVITNTSIAASDEHKKYLFKDTLKYRNRYLIEAAGLWILHKLLKSVIIGAGQVAGEAGPRAEAGHWLSSCPQLGADSDGTTTTSPSRPRWTQRPGPTSVTLPRRLVMLEQRSQIKFYF